MKYHVHLHPTDVGYACTVQALVNGVPTGPPLAIGTGATQAEARDAAMAVTTDPEILSVLRAYVPDE